MQQEINPSAENVRWVNAINRTPDHDGVVHLKIGQLNRVGNFFDNMLGKGVYIQGYEPWTLGEEKFDGIFWLDHSPNEQPVEQKENDAVAFEYLLGELQARTDRILHDKGCSSKEVHDAINDVAHELYNEYQKQKNDETRRTAQAPL